MNDKETEAFLRAIADMPDTLARGRDGMSLSHLDPDTAFVFTGLGGEGERLRYLVIAAAKSPPLDEDAVPALRSHWDHAAQAHKSAVESLEIAPRYVQVRLLIPMDVAPHDVVHESVTRCTAAGVALHERYFITNTSEPDEEEIAAILEELDNKDNSQNTFKDTLMASW
jgi:hypothetical protein